MNESTRPGNQSGQARHFVDLIARAKSGDELAFEELYDAYFTQLYRYILVRVGSSDDADDIVQLVFVKFYKNLSNWHDQGYSPSAYLYTIARSVIADHYRTHARRGKKIEDSEELLAIMGDESQNPHKNVLSKEETAGLYNALQALPENYQEALLLRYIENLQSREIAEIIGKSDVATRKLLSRAVSALAEVMHSKNQENDENEKIMEDK